MIIVYDYNGETKQIITANPANLPFFKNGFEVGCWHIRKIKKN